MANGDVCKLVDDEPSIIEKADVRADLEINVETVGLIDEEADEIIDDEVVERINE